MNAGPGYPPVGPGPWFAPQWPAPPQVRALVTTRGAANSAYGEFNLALHVGDEPRTVIANRAFLQRGVGADSVQWLQQVHGNRVLEINGAKSDEPQADAIYSAARGVALAVLTADCLPVLLCSPDEVAVAHAGWRGLASGILAATVACFRQPPEELLAWLGPAIGPSHFEVGAEVRAAFYDNPRFPGVDNLSGAFTPSPRRGHYYCDLYALARCSMQSVGVRQIYGGGFCTYREKRRFYSYRRQGVCGRMATIIMRE